MLLSVILNPMVMLSNLWHFWLIFFYSVSFRNTCRITTGSFKGWLMFRGYKHEGNYFLSQGTHLYKFFLNNYAQGMYIIDFKFMFLNLFKGVVLV